ncbi:hypothetical protein VKT23_006108 [Stygiomarasmius scandens]|uniref:F-box domain-containing protein n=1 Tax=Marasmiellus scandens TaxID=2682957 RepID=A0ABR1JRW9_9AGAR
MQSLPFELLQGIGSRVERLNDKKNLRETCSSLGGALQALVLEEVTLNIHKSNLQGLGLLRALADPEKKYSRYIRTLNILSLSPHHFPDSNPNPTWKACASSLQLDLDLVGEWLCDSEPGEGHEVCFRCVKVGTLLRPALESLENVRAVRWHWNLKDGLSTQTLVAESLSTLKHIRDFKFSYFHPGPFDGEPPLCLPDLHNLETLSISVSTGFRRTHLMTEKIIDPLLHHLLSRTERLSSLDLDTGTTHYPHFGLPVSFGIHVPSDISHIGLKGCYWSVSLTEGRWGFSKSLRACTHLTSLDLRVGDLGQSHQSIFNVLHSNQIRLRRIVIDSVTDPFLGYIASYSGLECLSIRFQPIRYPGIVTGMTEAEQFFRVILPLHRDTLVNLEIEPAYESEWCFSESNMDALSRCQQLRNLSVKVRTKGMKDSTIKHLLPFSRAHKPNPVVSVFPAEILIATYRNHSIYC